MALAFENLPVPLRADPHGVVRVAGTRVTLDTVVGAFRRGATPEEIVQDYSSLDFADVCAVVAYYLRNRSAVEAYLEEQRQKGEAIQRQMESLNPPAGIGERLLARKPQLSSRLGPCPSRHRNE
jgi:uncharacterized protein (DUF433 family)